MRIRLSATTAIYWFYDHAEIMETMETVWTGNYVTRGRHGRSIKPIWVQ